MEFKIMKINKNIEEARKIPLTFENIYYRPGAGVFGSLAAFLIFSEDGSFTVSGSDIELKKFVEQLLLDNKGKLSYRGSARVGDYYVSTDEKADFQDPVNFAHALDEALTDFSIKLKRNYRYVAHPGIVKGMKKIGSISDVRKLNEERKNVIQRARKKRAEDFSK